MIDVVCEKQTIASSHSGLVQCLGKAPEEYSQEFESPTRCSHKPIIDYRFVATFGKGMV